MSNETSLQIDEMIEDTKDRFSRHDIEARTFVSAKGQYYVIFRAGEFTHVELAYFDSMLAGLDLQAAAKIKPKENGKFLWLYPAKRVLPDKEYPLGRRVRDYGTGKYGRERLNRKGKIGRPKKSKWSGNR